MPRTLLLADDSITIQKAVQITFAVEDTQVIVVDNGEDALDKAREIRPDIVVADVVMPRRNGYDLAQAIKSDAALSQIPVLLLAGTFEPFDEVRASQAKADGYLVKPFDSQALIDKVNELSGGRPAAAAAPRPAIPAAQPTLTPAVPVAPQPFRPSAPPSPPASAPIRPPATATPAPVMARPPAPSPVVPSLSAMPGMRPAGASGVFSASRPQANPLTPPSPAGAPAARPSPPAASRPDPFAGLPPTGAPRPGGLPTPLPGGPASRPIPPMTRPAAPATPAPPVQASAPAAATRPTAQWPAQPAQPRPAPVTPAPRSPTQPMAPVAPPPAPARPTLTGWDTLGTTPSSEPAARGHEASFMAEAAAAASFQDSPGDLALDVPLEDEGTESPLQAISRPDAGFELGDPSDRLDANLYGGSLSDLAQSPAGMPETGIDIGEDAGDFGDRLELAAPHEFLGGPSAPVAAPAPPVAASAAARASPAPVRPAAAAPAAPSAASGDSGEAALRAALSNASREVIERVVWEVVPPLVEVIVREHVERLARSREK
jgi:CheY-like chemotaxis protein